jgi:hypothetical protein
MPLRTLTVGDLQKLLAGVEPSQPLLLINDKGAIVEVNSIHPEPATDKATDQPIFVLNFETNRLEYFIYERSEDGKPTNVIDTSDD